MALPYNLLGMCPKPNVHSRVSTGPENPSTMQVHQSPLYLESGVTDIARPGYVHIGVI
jgi:hypothetical protein